jgi:hypothetical protein
MVERFLLDRVEAKAARTAVGCQNDLIALPRTHKAEGALTFMQSTEARTQVALDATIFKFVPVSSRMGVEQFHCFSPWPAFRFAPSSLLSNSNGPWRS